MPSFILPLILGIFTFSLYAASTNHPSFGSTSQSQAIMTGGKPQRWHKRALQHLYSNPESFVPRLENLKLALLRNGPVDQKGFSLAIFAEDNNSGYVGVDAMGRVLNLTSSPSDVERLLELGDKTLGLPVPKTFRNLWKIECSTTSQPIDSFFYVSAEGKRQTSVSGYSQTKAKLKLVEAVGDYHYLPDDLQQLFGLVLKAREGFKPDRNGGNADPEVISKVMEVLDGLNGLKDLKDSKDSL